MSGSVYTEKLQSWRDEQNARHVLLKVEPLPPSLSTKKVEETPQPAKEDLWDAAEAATTKEAEGEMTAAPTADPIPKSLPTADPAPTIAATPADQPKATLTTPLCGDREAGGATAAVRDPMALGYEVPRKKTPCCGHTLIFPTLMVGCFFIAGFLGGAVLIEGRALKQEDKMKAAQDETAYALQGSQARNAYLRQQLQTYVHDMGTDQRIDESQRQIAQARITSLQRQLHQAWQGAAAEREQVLEDEQQLKAVQQKSAEALEDSQARIASLQQELNKSGHIIAEQKEDLARKQLIEASQANKAQSLQWKLKHAENITMEQKQEFMKEQQLQDSKQKQLKGHISSMQQRLEEDNKSINEQKEEISEAQQLQASQKNAAEARIAGLKHQLTQNAQLATAEEKKEQFTEQHMKAAQKKLETLEKTTSEEKEALAKEQKAQASQYRTSAAHIADLQHELTENSRKSAVAQKDAQAEEQHLRGSWKKSQEALQSSQDRLAALQKEVESMQSASEQQKDEPKRAGSRNSESM